MNWEIFTNRLSNRIDALAIQNQLSRLFLSNRSESSFKTADFDQDSLLLRLRSDDYEDYTEAINAKNLIKRAIKEVISDFLSEGILSHTETSPIEIDHRNFAYVLFETGIEDDDYRTILNVHEGDFYILINLYKPYM